MSNKEPDLEKQLSYYLWPEKYRPKTLEDIILPKHYKKAFKKIIKDNEIPNIILHSTSPGTSKTTLSKVFCYDLKANYRYINMSEKGGIDTLRNDISKFASMKSLNGKPKIVILDEFQAPNASINLQNGMKAAIEEFKNSCRFIFTTNIINSIIEPIQSRCEVYDFNFKEKSIQDEIKPQMIERLCGILTIEEVEFKVETVEKLVETFFPDMRRMITICQKYSKTSGCINEEIFKFDNVSEEFYDFILSKNYRKAREYLIQKNYNYSELYRELFDNLIPKVENTSKRGQIIITIAEYMYRHSIVIDPEINAAACLLEIITILNEKD